MDVLSVKFSQLVLATCIVFLMFSLPVNSEIYTWKDEQGNVHFGDKKVDGVQQKQVALKVQQSDWQKYLIEINDVDQVLTTHEREQISRDVNLVYEFYDNQLYFNMYKTVPVKIRLYQKQGDYERYLAKKYNANGKHSRGIYIGSSNEIVVYINPVERWRTFWTIKHEASHAIVDTVTPFVPAWLNEGLAENMEALSLQDNMLILGPHNENYATSNQAYQQGKLLDMKQFLTLSSHDFYQQLRSGGSYNQANAGELVRLLLSSPPGKSFITRLIHIYEQGSKIFGAYVVDEHYIGGLSVLQHDWQRWLRRDKSKTIKL